MTAREPAKVGRVRFAVLALIFVANTINYADRATVSIAGPALSKDLGLSAIDLGFVFSAFGWAYVIGQLPGGWLLDRFGSRLVYAASIVAWSLFTMVQGLVAGASALPLLFLLRFMVGLSEAPSFPGNGRLVAAWFPAAERGTASAIFNSAQYFATVLFAPIMGWITFTYGWRHVFFFMGAIGLLFSLVWLRWVHPPSRHPRIGEAELAHLRAGGALVDLDADRSSSAPAPQGQGREGLKVLLTSRTMWGVYIAQYAVTALTNFFITWFPVYLVQQRGMTILSAGLVASVPAVCGFLGGILGGIWSDWLLRRGFSLTAARKIPIITGMLLAIGIAGCNYVDNPALIVAFMALAFFGKGVGSLGWAVVSDTVPKAVAGLGGGVFNMFGNIASITTPIVIGYLVHVTGNYEFALVFVAVNALLAAASYAFIAGEIRRLDLPRPAAGTA
jgi:ACS family glucarate transporter-like MFS transporter